MYPTITIVDIITTIIIIIPVIAIIVIIIRSDAVCWSMDSNPCDGPIWTALQQWTTQRMHHQLFKMYPHSGNQRSTREHLNLRCFIKSPKISTFQPLWQKRAARWTTSHIVTPTQPHSDVHTQPHSHTATQPHRQLSQWLCTKRQSTPSTHHHH